MYSKRTMLPANFQELLDNKDIEGLKNVYELCTLNAKNSRLGTNAFATYPLPREFAFWLKDQGVDVDLEDKRGVTPLFYQLRKENSGVPLLVELGANIHHALVGDRTIIHEAVLCEDITAVELAVEKGVNINIISDMPTKAKCCTPLERYMMLKKMPVEYVEFAEVLRRNGAVVTNKLVSIMKKLYDRYQAEKPELDEETIRINDEAIHKLLELFKIGLHEITGKKE